MLKLISHASKIMFKILQARLQQYMKWELPDVQAQFTKGRGTRDQVANICWITEKAREFQKNLCFIDYAKAFGVGSQFGSQQTGKFFKRWEYQTTLPASRKICLQVKEQQLEPDKEQGNSSKLEKEYIKAVHCHLTYRVHHVKCQAGWNHKLESRFPGEININNPIYADDTKLTAENEA